jgi:hypothetical protein
MNTDNPEDQIVLWHTLALNVTAVDHTSELNATGNQINFEQYGPLRTSYALAIIHIAMFEVANAYAPTGSHYKSWIVQAGGMAPATPPNGASEAAAIIGAAYATLIDLYPNLQAELQQQRDIALSQLAGSTTSRSEGESYGELIAKQIIAIRANDGSQLPEPRWGVDFVPLRPAGPNGLYPKGQWQVDPVSNIQTALWRQLAPGQALRAEQRFAVPCHATKPAGAGPEQPRLPHRVRRGIQPGNRCAPQSAARRYAKPRSLLPRQILVL